METPLKKFKDSVKAKMKEQAELIGGDNWITDLEEFKVKMKPEIKIFKHEDKDQSDHHKVLNEVFKENMKRHRPLFYSTTKYYRQDQIEEEQLLLLQEKERRKQAQKQAQVLLEIQSLVHSCYRTYEGIEIYLHHLYSQLHYYKTKGSLMAPS